MIKERKVELTPTANKSESRRAFLRKLGAGGLFLAFAGNIFAWTKFLIPSGLSEPVYRFKVGLLKNIPFGVNALSKEQEFLIKDENGVHAMSGTCTHLGCTLKQVQLSHPKKVKINGKEIEMSYEFHCPCHSSKFYADGTNFAGPAPSPLPWHKVDLNKGDGQLVVDKKVVVKKGTYFTGA